MNRQHRQQTAIPLEASLMLMDMQKNIPQMLEAESGHW
jgi:hypothetical protein